MTKQHKQSTKETLVAFLTPEKNEVTIALGRDVATSILIVSVTINLMFFIGWLALKISDLYDAQVVHAILS